MEVIILGRYQCLESGEDFLNSTEIPSKLPNNLKDLEKDVIGSNLTMEDMAKLWST